MEEVKNQLQYLSDEVHVIIEHLKHLCGGVSSEWVRHVAIATTDLESVEDRLTRAIKGIEHEGIEHEPTTNRDAKLRT
jgi:hypothetical protein